MTDDPRLEEVAIDYLKLFRMPKAVTITGRTSSITNSFINSIIPVVVPTRDEVRDALRILGMTERIACIYCGDASTEWDHLRPLVVGKKPTGYISEIHNLVPSCGKCNQSKGNMHWRAWMFGPASLSPASRGIADLEERAQRLEQYEKWLPPTKLDFESIAGTDLWSEHWDNYDQIVALMKSAQVTASRVREATKLAYLDQETDLT